MILINTDQYMEKMKSVLDEKSTQQRNLWKSSYYVVEPLIYPIMADYIYNKYGAYYANERPALITEHQRIFKACLNKLGIK